MRLGDRRDSHIIEILIGDGFSDVLSNALYVYIYIYHGNNSLRSLVTAGNFSANRKCKKRRARRVITKSVLPALLFCVV